MGQEQSLPYRQCLEVRRTGTLSAPKAHILVIRPQAASIKKNFNSHVSKKKIIQQVFNPLLCAKQGVYLSEQERCGVRLQSFTLVKDMGNYSTDNNTIQYR